MFLRKLMIKKFKQFGKRIRRSTQILIKIHSVDAFSRKNKGLRRKKRLCPAKRDINR